MHTYKRGTNQQIVLIAERKGNAAFRPRLRGLSRERATYEDQVIGRLLPATWLGFDFRQRLVVDLQGPLGSFRTMTVLDMPSPRLKAEVKRFDGYEKTLESAAEAAASALRFLNAENLAMVALWIPSHVKGASAALREWVDGKEYRSLLQGAPK